MGLPATTNCHAQLMNAQGVKASAESEATEESEAQDNSRRLSLQELIQDVDGEKDAAAAAGAQEEEDPALVVQGVAEAAAEKPEQVVRRRVIGMMRRYVRVRRSIKTKHDQNVEVSKKFSELGK